jgi:hypothetical protein
VEAAARNGLFDPEKNAAFGLVIRDLPEIPRTVLLGGEPTVDYYEGIVRDTFGGDAARAQDQVRLFMVPGMGHCSGGIRGAAVGWDKLAPLVDWVENGKAPEQLVVRQDNATRTPQGNERILCPLPLQPTYVGPAGSGAEYNPANWVAPNFECRARP